MRKLSLKKEIKTSRAYVILNQTLEICPTVLRNRHRANTKSVAKVNESVELSDNSYRSHSQRSFLSSYRTKNKQKKESNELAFNLAVMQNKERLIMKAYLLKLTLTKQKLKMSKENEYFKFVENYRKLKDNLNCDLLECKKKLLDSLCRIK